MQRLCDKAEQQQQGRDQSPAELQEESCNTSHELQQLLQGSSCTTSGLVVQKQSPSSVKAKLRGGKNQLPSQLKSQMTAGSLLQLFNLTVTGS